MKLSSGARRLWQAACAGSLLGAVLLATAGGASGQDRKDYILSETKRLEIVVHILGEVTRPGEYLVADDTNVLELLSKAGGPTELANLGSVTLKRGSSGRGAAGGSANGRVIKIDINDYLKHDKSMPLPTLEPGDVVTVPRNSFSKWKTVFSMARDVSVVASLYFLYLREKRN